MQETWVSEAEATIVIKRLRGAETVPESIRGRRQFNLSTEERELNHSVHALKYDPFLNGTFTCLVGPDDLPESPNRLTADEVEAVIHGNWQRAKKRLELVTSSAVLERIMALAIEGGAGAKRLEMIRERILHLDPDRRFANHVHTAREAPAGGPSQGPQPASFYDFGPADTGVSVVPGAPARASA